MGRRPFLSDNRRPHLQVRCFQPLLLPSRAIVAVHSHCKPVPSHEADISRLTKGIPAQHTNLTKELEWKGRFRQVRISWKDVFKFLAGAAFVNAGVLFYLYLTNTAVPVLGTHFVMEPETNGLRSLVHFLFFLVLLLFWLYPPVTSSFTGIARCGWRGWCVRAGVATSSDRSQPSSRDVHSEEYCLRNRAFRLVSQRKSPGV